MPDLDKENDTLLDSLRKLTEQIAGGTVDFARNTATLKPCLVKAGYATLY
jgi:hypothetical protein